MFRNIKNKIIDFKTQDNISWVFIFKNLLLGNTKYNDELKIILRRSLYGLEKKNKRHN